MADAPSEPHKPRVLVVEDEPIVRRIVERGLRHAFEVTLATDGAEGLEIVRADAAFDVILTDIRMPRLDGFALYDEVRRLSPPLAARTVFMTASPDPTTVGTLSALGVVWLAKPFSIAELVRVLLEVVSTAKEKGSIGG